VRARLLLPALVLLAPLASAAELVPEWREGPAVLSFQGRAVRLEAGTFYATDGETFLYVNEGEDPRLRAGACDVPEEGEWVVVSWRNCGVARHPAVACSGMRACEEATGTARSCVGCDPRHRVVDRATRTGAPYEELLPDWRAGPAEVPFRNATLVVPEGARYATDGEAWLYVVNGSAQLMEAPPGGCGDPAGNGTRGTWVLVPPRECAWAAHPGVACWDFAPCEALGGVSRVPAPTDPTPTTRRPTTTSPFAPDCRAVQGLRCTPMPAWAAVAALGLACARPGRRMPR